MRIPELEKKAAAYARVRDARMQLNMEERALKSDLLETMKRHKKEKYEHEHLLIEIVHEQETVKVKVRTGGEEDEG